MSKSNIPLPPEIAAQLSEMIGTALCVYLTEFTKSLYDNPKSEASLDSILSGVANGIEKYSQAVGKPLAHTLALNLLDTSKETMQ